jgi:hypothetical protein
MDFGAKCDGVTDNFAAFQAALNAIPTGGTVTVPACGGTIPPSTGGGAPAALGTGFLISGGLVEVQAEHLIGLGNGAAIKCAVPNSAFGCLYVSDTGINDFRNSLTSVENIAIYAATGIGTAVDGIIVQAGNNMKLKNVVINNMTGNGVHVESTFTNGWVESLEIDTVRVVGSGLANFEFEVRDGCTNCFITQTTVRNSTSREPHGPAISLDSLNNQNGNYKISSWLWEGGEIECASTAAANCVELNQQSVDSGQPLESITFDTTTIENDGTANTGYCIGADKVGGGASIGPLKVVNSIYFNCNATGVVQTANIAAYDIDFRANGDLKFTDQYQISTSGGLSFKNQTLGSGSGTPTFGSSPCASSAVQWIPTNVNGTAGYVPFCHP